MRIFLCLLVLAFIGLVGFNNICRGEYLRANMGLGAGGWGGLLVSRGEGRFAVWIRL